MTDLVTLGFKADTRGLTTAQKELDKTTAAGAKLDSQSTKTERALGLVGTAIAALGVAASARQIIQYADSWSNLESQLKQVTSSQGELLDVQQKILSLAKETRTSLSATGGLYASLARNSEDLKLTQQELLSVTSTMNKLFLVQGTSAEQAAGALFQLNQGLAAGALRGDEFNSVAEGAPRVLDALSLSLGVAKGELREFAATGGITSEVLIEALQNYESTAERLASNVSATFAQNTQVATANITAFVGQSEILTGSVTALGESIVEISENIEAASSAAGSFGAVIAASTVPSIIKQTKATAASIVAKRAEAVATVESTAKEVENSAARLAEARSSQIALAGMLAHSKALNTNTSATATNATIRSYLTKNTSALVAAEAAHTVALGAASTAQARASITATTLGAAWRFMTGPIGLVITALGAAAVAFELSRDSMEESTRAAEDHADKMARLQRLYEAMTTQQLGSAYIEAQQAAIELDRERAELADRLATALENEAASNQRNGDARSKATNQYAAQVASLETQLSSLDERIVQNNENLDLMNQAFDKGVMNVGEWNNVTEESVSINEKVAKSFADQLVALDLQSKKLSLTNDEIEIYQARQNAIAKNYTPAMTKVIIQNIKALQAQRKAIKNTNADLDALMEGELFGFPTEETQDFNNELDSIISQVDDFGGAWSRTGNIIADSIGGAVSQLQDFSKRMEDIGGKQEELNKLRGEYADGTKEAIKIDTALAKLDEESANAKISAIGQTIGLTAQLFEENSKERKALHALEMGFMVAEIAMATQKAITTAVGAVANQGNGDPYTAFGRIAAMIGIMGGVLGAAGIAFSGGSGGGGGAAQTGGTGTVLGDSSSQSNSIANALEDFDDIQIDQLAELRGIRTALTGLSGGIQRLASQFATSLDFTSSGFQGELGTTQNMSGIVNLADKLGLSDILGVFGDSIAGAVLGGLFGSTKKKMVDSGISFMTQTIGDIFESGELDANLFQTIETTKKKLFGLSKKTSLSTVYSDVDAAILQQMGDIFGFIGESVIGAAESLGFESVIANQIDVSEVGPMLQEDMRKGLMGMFDSLGDGFGGLVQQGTNAVELSLRDALEQYQIDIGDISFKDKTGEEIQAELEAIFSQQADLIAEHLVPSITEYQRVGEGAFETLQRVAYEQAVFNDAMDNLGITFSDLSNTMQIDVAQSVIGLIGSVEDFAELTNSFFENFYSESEQLTVLEKSLEDVFESLGLSMVDSREGFRDLVEGIDVTTEEGQQLLAALLEINPAMAEYLDQLDELANEKLDLQIRLLEAQGKSEEALALARQMELEATDESLRELLKQIWALEDAAKAERERTQALEEAERLANQRKSLQVQLLEAQGKEEEALKLQRELQLAQMDESLRELQKQIWAQEDLNKAKEEEIRANEEALQLLRDNVAFAEDQLESARQAEVARINATVTAAEEAYDAQIEAINMQRQAYDELISQLESDLKNAESALNAVRNAEVSRIKSTLTAAEEAYDAQIKAVGMQRKAYNDLLNELESGLKDAESALKSSLSAELSWFDEVINSNNEVADEQIKRIQEVENARLDSLQSELSIARSVASQLGAASKSVTAAEALSQARLGNFDPATRIESQAGFSSAIDKRIAAAREDFALNEIGKLADAQVSDLEKSISAVEDSRDAQIKAARDIADKLNEELLIDRQKLEDQVNAILGVDSAVLSLTDAIAQYQNAQSDLDAALNSDTLEELQKQEDLALEQIEQARESASLQIEALNSQIDAILGVDNSVLSLSDAINQYQSAQADLDEALNNGTIEELQKQEALALEQLEQAKESASLQLEALNKQVDELLGINDAVVSVEEAIKLLLHEREALSEFETSQIDMQQQTKAAVETSNAILEEIKQGVWNPIHSEPTNPITTGPIDLTPTLPIDTIQPIIVAPLAEEIKGLRRDLDRQTEILGENTSLTASSVRKIEYLQSDTIQP